MSLVSEFREFAVKGNVLDLAVGVIIGAAFGKIVTSLVEDVFMPVIGRVTGPVQFADKFIDLSGKHPESLAQAKQMGAATLNYGAFINNAINFLIIAFIVFTIVKAVNHLKREPVKVVEEAKPAEPTREEVLLTEIRDALVARPASS